MHHNTDMPHTYPILRPLSWLYSVGVWIRNKLFDYGILPVEEFDIPIISVGNLTVGGTGKTPHIEYIIQRLSPHYRVAVLSRGYGRKSTGFILADTHATALTIGDEPYQMHCKYPDILIAVDSNRRRGIKKLLQQTNAPEVILLDDAYQHRYVHPSLSIVLCDNNRPIYADYLLPSGRLREPATNIKRADIVIISKCLHALSNQDLQKEAKLLQINPDKLFASHIKYGKLQHFTSGERLSLEEIPRHTPIYLLTGIANPQPMLLQLTQYYDCIIPQNYPDHHNFTTQEIKEIYNEYKTHSNSIIITTEKDAARLRCNNMIWDIADKIYILPIEIDIQENYQGEKFDTLLLQSITRPSL